MTQSQRPALTTIEILMTVNKKLTNEELAALEDRAKQGSVEAMLEFTSDLVPHYYNNISEIERRKSVLLSADHSGHIKVLRRITVFSAMTNDFKNWECSVESLGAYAGAGLGYFAYQYIVAQGADENQIQSWIRLLEYSASRGHLQARRELFKWQVKKYGLPGKFAYFIYRVWIALHVWPMMLKDRSDQRLPLSARRKP